MAFDPKEVNTVIVGAGPIGLLNAIGLLTKNPNQKLVMLEKYDSYKRNHTLQVDYKQVKKYLEACGEPQDPAILELLKQVKKSKFIRISAIEKLLKERAVKLGAEIITGQGVTDFNKQVKEKYPNADLIIGADGTRSVVSQQAIGESYVFEEMTEETVPEDRKMYFRIVNDQLTYTVLNPKGELIKDKPLEGFKFSSPLDLKKLNDQKKDILQQTSELNDTAVKENSEKKEFDFVMQLRVEVEGDVEKIPLPTLMRLMQNYGITCDEYVGKRDENGMTPITFQLMISKEQFKILEEKAKSGNPIRPFSGSDENANLIPPVLMQRLTGYLGLRLRHFTKEDEVVRLDTATISVNEAPATYAKEVYKRLDDGKGPDVVLVGDAAMGLSYFKGINAAFEASAKLLGSLSQPHEKRQEGLNTYKQWFNDIYVPKKVKEVETYSTFVIRAVVGVFKTLQFIIRSDKLMRSDIAERTVDMYRGHLAEVNKQKERIKNGDDVELPFWKYAYEHNGRSLENVLTLKPQSSIKILGHIGKNITDFAQPYKSNFHFIRDLLTPIRAIYQLGAGILKMVVAIPVELVSAIIGVVSPGKDKSRMDALRESGSSFLAKESEGISRILLGLSLAVSSIFMPFKVASRGVLTIAKSEPLLAEDNKGMKKLLNKSDEIISELGENTSSVNAPEANGEELESRSDQCSSYAKLHALSIDVHRKFHKSTIRGQKTEVVLEEEEKLFKQCIDSCDVTAYKTYLGIFKHSSKEGGSQDTCVNGSLRF